MKNFYERMQDAYKSANAEQEITIDDVFTRRINGEIYKQVSYWRNRGRYSAIVDKNADIPEVGQTIPYSNLKKMIIPREKFEELERY